MQMAVGKSTRPTEHFKYLYLIIKCSVGNGLDRSETLRWMVYQIYEKF